VRVAIYTNILISEDIVLSIPPHIRVGLRVGVRSRSRQNHARIMRTHVSPPKSRMAKTAALLASESANFALVNVQAR